MDDEEYKKTIDQGLRTMLWILRTLPQVQPKAEEVESPYPQGFVINKDAN